MFVFVVFGEKGNYPLYSQGEAFPFNRYNAKEKGLLYFKRYPLVFNGPFYGFTPDSDPNGDQFIPELFFIHGPTYVEGYGNGPSLRALLANDKAKQRLLQALDKVLMLRNPRDIVQKYKMEVIPPLSTINILYREADWAKGELIAYINDTRKPPFNDNVDKHNRLMAVFDTATKDLEEACLKRNAHIRQMNTHYDLLALQAKQANDLIALNAKFDSILKNQDELKQQLLERSTETHESQ